jgi:hypothetical protein
MDRGGSVRSMTQWPASFIDGIYRLAPALSRPLQVLRVGGGIRTLGHWNHNPALYQLSYTHHGGNILSLANSAERRS